MRTIGIGVLSCLLVASAAFLLGTSAQADAVGMGDNFWYTNTLENNLIGQGHSVTVVNTYTAASLSAFDVYIQDGNSHFDAAALEAFVFNGGTLIQLPWSQTHNTLSANTIVIGSRTGISTGGPNPAITVLDAGNWLLDGVTLPGAGAHTIGRETGNAFVAGNPVLEWADGTAMLGYREYGAGRVVSLNLHLITSDSSPLDADWSNQIVYNAIGDPVPEPASLALFGLGAAGLALSRRRRKRVTG